MLIPISIIIFIAFCIYAHKQPDPYKMKTHYNINSTCANCGDRLLVLIPKGVSEKSYFKNNAVICGECGHKNSGLKRVDYEDPFQGGLL